MSQHVSPPFDLAFGAPHTIRFSDAINTGLLGYPLYCYDRGLRAAAFRLHGDATSLLGRALGGGGTPADFGTATEILEALLDHAEGVPSDLRIVCAIPVCDGVSIIDVPAEVARFTSDALVTPEHGSPMALVLDLAEALRDGEVAEVWYEKPGHALKEGDVGTVSRLGDLRVSVARGDGKAILVGLDSGSVGPFDVEPGDVLVQRRRAKPVSIFAAKRKGLPGYRWPITVTALDIEKGAERAFLLERISRVAIEWSDIPF